MGIYDQNPSAPGYADAIRQAMAAQGLGGPRQGPQMAPGGANGGSVDPGTVQAMLALQGQAPAAASVARQLAQAQAMRQQGQKGMQQQTFGNGQVAAPNWAGALANVYAMKKAGDMEKDAGNKEAALSQARQATLGGYYDDLTGGQSGGRQQSGARQDALRRYFDSLSSRGGGVQQMPTSGGYDGMA